MRLWVIPAFAVVVVLGSNPRYEPTELQMREAFAGALALQVRNALDFVRESGGEAAVNAIRDAGTDRFSIDGFRKIGCERAGNEAPVCSFAVDLNLVSGLARHTLSGRFSVQPGGYVFVGI